MRMRHRTSKTIILLLLLAFSTSCDLLVVPVAFVGEPRKKVSAEFDKLPGNRVAVVVWADASTLFDYPYARLELATYVADKLRTELTRRRQSADVVDPRRVEDFLQKNLDAQVDPQAVGRAFEADYVVYLEVLTFQMREPEQPQFLRGHIQASVSVYDLRADPDQFQRYELVPVDCVYPQGAPVLINATNAPLVREATYRKFAELVSRKFYDHTVDLG